MCLHNPVVDKIGLCVVEFHARSSGYLFRMSMMLKGSADLSSDFLFPCDEIDTTHDLNTYAVLFVKDGVKVGKGKSIEGGRSAEVSAETISQDMTLN